MHEATQENGAASVTQEKQFSIRGGIVGKFDGRSTLTATKSNSRVVVENELQKKQLLWKNLGESKSQINRD
jgi:hypothetical protein